MTNPYVPLLIMSAAALVLAFGGLVASAILGPTEKVHDQGRQLRVRYPADQRSPHRRAAFPVRYYLVAMTFIIFDIEVVFMYPWAVSFNQLGLFGLVVMMSFLVTLCVPYAYEWRRGGLDY